jgi:large subunit ribosomal protein L19
MKPAGNPVNVVQPPPSSANKCKNALMTMSAKTIAQLDPTGARTRLFSLDNTDGVQVRDVVLVRQRDGDPFAGVVMRIKRCQQDTSVWLRNTITGVGVEMEFKIYSPLVTGIEVVQRRPKAPKQRVLMYLRYVPAITSLTQRVVCGANMIQKPQTRCWLRRWYRSPIP